MEEEKDQFELAEAILSGKELDENNNERLDYSHEEEMEKQGEEEDIALYPDVSIDVQDFDEAERILKGEDEFSTAESILNTTGSQNTSKVMKAVLVVPGSSVFNDLFILGEI